MKKKIFSKGLYFETLRQLRLPGIILLVLSVFGAAIEPFFELVNYLSYRGETINGSWANLVNYESIFTMLPVIVFVAPVFAFIIFSQFNRRVASDFYHSLPYTRLCKFVSFTLGILTCIAAIGIVYCGVSLAIHACLPFLYIISFAGMFDFLLTVIAATLLSCFGVICALSLTGTPLANIILALLILFGPRAALFVISGTVQEMAPIVSIGGGFLDPTMNVLFDLVCGFNYDPFTGNMGSDVYSICIALVYIVLAAVFFCTRKSETAGQTAGSKYLQDGIRIALAFAISGAGTCLGIMSEEFEVVIVLYVLALIAYFAFELITKKNFKALVRTVPALGILVALNVAVLAVCHGSAAVIHSYTPDADEIKGFYLIREDNDYYGSAYEYQPFGSYVDAKSEEILITDENAIKIMADSLKESVEESENGKYYQFTYDTMGGRIEYDQKLVRFVSENGTKKDRLIWIKSELMPEVAGALEKNNDYKALYTELPEALDRSVYLGNNYLGAESLDNIRVSEIYEKLREEVKTVNFAEWYTFASSIGYGSGNPSEYYLELTTKDEGKNISININKDYTPETHRLILEMLNEGAKEKAAEVKKFFDEYDFDSVYDEEYGYKEGYYFSIEVYTFSEKEGRVWCYSVSPYLKSDGSTSEYEFAKEFMEQMVNAANTDAKPTSEEYTCIALYKEVPVEGSYYYKSESIEFIIPYTGSIEFDTNYCYEVYEYAEYVK